MLNSLATILDSGVPVSTNSFESIATYVLGSDGNISFTSIPSTYKHLQVRILGKSSYAGSGTGNMYFTFNNDTTSSNYYRHRLWGFGGGSAYADADASTNICGFVPEGNVTSTYGATIIDILDYTSTNKNKTVRTLSGTDMNGSGTLGLFSNLWSSTAAINRIDFTQGGAFFKTGSHFALYGIKG